VQYTKAIILNEKKQVRQSFGRHRNQITISGIIRGNLYQFETGIAKARTSSKK